MTSLQFLGSLMRMEVAVGTKEVVLIFIASKRCFEEIQSGWRGWIMDDHSCHPQVASLRTLAWHPVWRGIKGRGIKGFSQGSEQKECSSPVTDSWDTGGRKQFVSPHSFNEGMLWQCCPLTLLLVESSLRLSYSPRSPFFSTGTETTYHTTTMCYFRHWDRVLQFQAVINYWLFEIYNKCFFHRTEIWWWLQLATPVKPNNCCLKKRSQTDPYFKIWQTQNWQLLCHT